MLSDTENYSLDSWLQAPSSSRWKHNDQKDSRRDWERNQVARNGTSKTGSGWSEATCLSIVVWTSYNCQVSLMKHSIFWIKMLAWKKITVNITFSSLHWLISLSFCSFSYNGVYCDIFKLSADDLVCVRYEGTKC